VIPDRVKERVDAHDETLHLAVEPLQFDDRSFQRTANPVSPVSVYLNRPVLPPTVHRLLTNRSAVQTFL